MGAASPPEGASPDRPRAEHRRPAHIPTLDGARGVAALLVVVSHAANAGLLPIWLGSGAGQQGVLVFFVLSGFLMAHLYGPTPPAAGELRAFWVKRVARVVPLFVLVAVVGATVHSVLGLDLPEITLADLHLHLLLVDGEGVLWTIPVEMQYYLVFAVLWSAGLLRRRALFVAAIPAAWLLGRWVRAADVTWPGVALLAWGWSFLVGTAIGTVIARWRADLERWGQRWPAVGWVALPLLVLTLPGVRRVLGLYWLGAVWADPVTALGAIGFFVLALAGAGPFRLLARPRLRWLGSISYSLYLLHMPIVYAVQAAVGPDPGLVARAVGAATVVGLSLVVARVSHDHLEVPLGRAVRRRLGVRSADAVPSPST